MEVKKYDKIQHVKKKVEGTKKSSPWFASAEANEALVVAKRLRNSTNGMQASIPILCRAETCPYAEACELQQMGIAPYGEKCPMEIAAIEDLFQRYCSDMNIDPTDPAQQVDAIMVKEVVDLDIGILRCDKKIAISADYIIENVVGVTDDQMPITQQMIHPIADLKEKLRNQKYKTLNLLNSTRKDKAGTTITVNSDPTQRAAELMNSMNVLDAEEERAIEKEKYYEKLNNPRTSSEVIEAVEVEEEEEE